MLATFDAYRPSAHDLTPASEVVARAFFDDPMWEYILPSASSRARDIGWLIDMAIRYGHRFGDVRTIGTPVVGAAVWLPPGATTITPDRLDEVGFAAAPARLGPGAFERFNRLIGRLGELHATLMPDPHWYLMMVGIDTPLQRRGLGSLLLRPILERATEGSAPCYLETARERNLPFFARHGFDVVGEMHLPGAPRTWLMMRR